MPHCSPPQSNSFCTIPSKLPRVIPLHPDPDSIAAALHRLATLSVAFTGVTPSSPYTSVIATTTASPQPTITVALATSSKAALAPSAATTPWKDFKTYLEFSLRIRKYAGSFVLTHSLPEIVANSGARANRSARANAASLDYLRITCVHVVTSRDIAESHNFVSEVAPSADLIWQNSLCCEPRLLQGYQRGDGCQPILFALLSVDDLAPLHHSSQKLLVLWKPFRISHA